MYFAQLLQNEYFYLFQVNNIVGEYVHVQCFIPVTKKDPTRFYLEEKEITLHASRIEEYDHPMTEVMDYNGPNPKRRRIYRQVHSGETGVRSYGTIMQQIPPH